MYASNEAKLLERLQLGRLSRAITAKKELYHMKRRVARTSGNRQKQLKITLLKNGRPDEKKTRERPRGLNDCCRT